MTVLPKEATLVSFAVLLVIVLIITTFIALNLRSIFSMLVCGQQMVSNFIYSSTQHSKNEKWKNFARNSSGPNKEVVHGDTRTTSNTISILAFYDFLIALPTNELAYGINLIKPVRAGKLPWYVEVRFSYGKLVGDLIRLLLLPMWMVLSLPYWVLLGVMTLFRAIRKRIGSSGTLNEPYVG
jgi:hypothetical protein